MKYLAFLLLVCLFAAESHAQLFSRWGRAQVSSSNCPGGVCPVPQAATRYVSPPVATAVQNTFGQYRGHWSFPGDIDSHLEGTHGVSTAGMSLQQKLDYHDSLHEGTAPQVRQASAVVVRGTYPTVSSSSGYGSVGSTVSYGSTGSKANYGSVGSSYRVGGRDVDGAVIIKINEPKPYMAKPVASNNDLTSVRQSQTTFGL